jgi:hypothetical protein
MTEAQATRRLMCEIKDLGAWPIKLNDATRAGLPDVIVFRRSRSTVLVEVKKADVGSNPIKQLSPVQMHHIEALADLGTVVFLAVYHGPGWSVFVRGSKFGDHRDAWSCVLSLTDVGSVAAAIVRSEDRA